MRRMRVPTSNAEENRSELNEELVLPPRLMEAFQYRR